MVAQYFIMKNSAIVIEFISSSNKLKIVEKDTDDENDENDENDGGCDETTDDNKTSYASRKKKGVAVCLHLLKDYETMTTYLKTHKKKDDLADAFLQGMWYINKYNK